MTTTLTVRDLLTEVGTLVGMYDNEYRIDATPPGNERVYCSELASNGHTSDSLSERWVVLKASDGSWKQRKILSYEPSSNILSFQHSTGREVVFEHTDAVLYLFDRAAPELVLRTVIPALAAQPHLAQFSARLGLDLGALHAEYVANQDREIPVFANDNWRMVDKQGVTASIGISNIRGITSVRRWSQDIPFDDWKWDYYGRGEYADNGVLRIKGEYLTSKIEIVFNQTPEPSVYGIGDWSQVLVEMDPYAKECLKYHCAARWMQATLPSRDEEGWNYAKKTETHFRNRAADLDVVLPHTLR